MKYGIHALTQFDRAYTWTFPTEQEAREEAMSLCKEYPGAEFVVFEILGYCKTEATWTAK
jgi:hypothetical protein